MCSPSLLVTHSRAAHWLSRALQIPTKSGRLVQARFKLNRPTIKPLRYKTRLKQANLSLRDAGVKALTRGLGRNETGLALEKIAGQTESGKELYEQAFGSQSIQDMSKDTSERRAMAAIRAINQDGRLGDLLMSQYNPFDFNVNQGDANSNAGLTSSAAKATAGTDAIAGKLDAKWNSNAGAYASSNDMNASGYQATKEDGATVIGQRNSENMDPVIDANSQNQDHVSNRSSQAAYETLAARGKLRAKVRI